MEFVFVVPRHELFPDSYPHGLRLFGEEFDETRLLDAIEEHGFFVERAVAERTPAWKQVIPYTVVEKDGLVLLLRRTKGGGEARLHDKLSIGVGGHINPVDLPRDAQQARPRNPIPHATRREVCEEELRIDSPDRTRPVGLLNDDSNPVGAVHVGYVQVMSVHGTVEVRETDQLEGDFVTLDQLRSMLADGENFETWSSLLIERLEQYIPDPVAN